MKGDWKNVPRTAKSKCEALGDFMFILGTREDSCEDTAGRWLSVSQREMSEGTNAVSILILDVQPPKV